MLYFQRFRTQIGVIWGHRAPPEYAFNWCKLVYELVYGYRRAEVLLPRGFHNKKGRIVVQERTA